MDEELLEFDQQGRLVDVKQGGRSRGDGIAISDIAGSIGGPGANGMGNDDDDYGSVSSSALGDDSSSYLGGANNQSLRSKSIVRGSEVASELGGTVGRHNMDESHGLELAAAADGHENAGNSQYNFT